MSGAYHFKNVCKSFPAKSGKEKLVLNNFSFESGPGINCLLGASGVGKTTLLRMCAGLDKLVSGEIFINGKKPSKQQVAYMSQNNTLLGWRDLCDNVALPLELQRIPRVRRRDIASEVLAQVGLEGADHHYPHELSEGMKQRTMIARQIMSGSRYWLLDEPFTSLDQPTRFSLHKLLLDLHSERELNILLVTHDLSEALSLGRRIAVMPQNGVGQAWFMDLPLSGAGDSQVMYSYHQALEEKLNEQATCL